MADAGVGSRAGALPRDRAFPGLLLCLFVSGASGLIYEVSWMRSLELVFGATSFAIATVLVAFMGGLALGSRLMGTLAERLERFHPLRVYAALECLIGACGLLVPPALRALVPLYRSIWDRYHASFAVFSLWRFLLCGAILLVPTALMGATLPITSRLAAAGRRIGLLYAWNTLGAVAGCAAAGFVLLPAIGLHRTEWVAAGLNFLAAGAALLLARRAVTGTRAKEFVSGHTLGEAADRIHRPAVAAPLSARATTTLIVLYAVSGAVAMVFEVAWSRLLVLVLGSSTYSYTVMLTTFLAGLALGAGLGARLLKHRIDPLPAAALCQIAVALLTYAGLYLMRDLPYLYVLAHNVLEPSPRGLIVVQLVLASALMLLPTLGFGAMFPIVIAGLQPAGSGAPRVVGRAYSWNTVGAILGSIAAGFFIVPRWGSRDALLLGVAVSAVMGLVALIPQRLAADGRLRALLAVAVVVFLANLVFAAPALPPEILSSGAFRYADRYRGLDRAAFAERVRVSHGEIQMFKEGLTCTVTVFRTTAARTLLVNGKPDASAPPGLPEPFVGHVVARTGDLATQVLVAQLPMLLAPRADQVLVIGLGSGVSLGSVLTHQARTVECVELEDAVVKASRFFDGDSGAPLDDPRVRLVVNDARNHLLVTRKRYDVVISEPSNPWVAGAASLFTRDFFEIAGSRLAPGGLFCQWIQLYEMTSDDFRAILRSFQAVFPDVHLFRVASDAILIGSDGRVPLHLDAIPAARLTGRPGHDLARIGVGGPADLLAHYWIGGAELRAALDRGPLNTDDNMLIEFAAPLRMMSRRPELQARQARELAEMFAQRTTGVISHFAPGGSSGPAGAAFWARTADATLKRGYPDLALVYAARSLRDAKNPVAARVHGESLAGLGHVEAARSWLGQAAREYTRDADLLRSLIPLERAASDWPAVKRDARALRRLVTGDRQARYWEGDSLYRLEEHREAALVLAPLVPKEAPPLPRSALARGTAAAAPSVPPPAEFPELGLLLGSIDLASGRRAAAVAPLREYVAGHSSDRVARAMLARALEISGRGREAQAVRRRLDPDAPRQAALRLAEAVRRWETGPREDTQALLETAREYDPDDDAVAFLLARSRLRLGDSHGARVLLEEFLDSHPDRPWAIGYLAQLDAMRGDTGRALILGQRYLALTGRLWESIFEDEGD